MKKLFLLVLLPFLFSGCVTFSANHQPEYISSELNQYLAKVENNSVSVEPTYNVIKKHPQSVKGGLAYIEIPGGEIASKISLDFFKEYFSNVSYGNNQADFKSKIMFEDFEIKNDEGFLDGSEIYMKFKYILYYRNKLILDKTYESKKHNNVIISPFRLNISDASFELFHKMVLEMFENQIKPDILEIL